MMLILCLGVAVTGCNRLRVSRENHPCSPLQFGLKEAKTAIERYYVLQRTHEEASRRGANVSYAGIKEITIEIPSKAKSIPLTHHTDFANVVLKVKNNQKDLYLFSLADKLTPVNVKGREIDNGIFSKHQTLRSGRKLLVVSDKTPWVEKRTGYDFGATRKDIMLLENGVSGNGPVQSYSTPASIPEGQYREVEDSKIVIKNITFQRLGGSTKKTYLIKAENQYDLELTGITISTPNSSDFYGDRAIYLINCYKVQMNDVSINGTYSLEKRFGYGVCLDNVYDFRVNNMYARANWGVFGTNNVNNAHLTNCDINRFDIHCYGKDIRFDSCNFVDLYNQFASVYGVIEFRNCVFTRCKPVHTGSSYNAYTGCEIKFERCVFNMDKKHQSIMDFDGFCILDNPRPELKNKCLPNITMIDCQVNMLDGTKTWCVYNTKKMKDYEGSFHYVSKVTIKGVSYDKSKTEMAIFSKGIRSINKVLIIKE